MWREGSGPLGTGDPVVDVARPHFATPVTVVSDDVDALVVWLRTGTRVLRAVRADGLDKRADKSSLFTAEVVLDSAEHLYYDQLRVARREALVCVGVLCRRQRDVRRVGT